jgi:streptomycin 6-kinase
MPLSGPLPPGFVQRVTAVWGATGDSWLEQLPGLVDAYAHRWSLDSLETPFELSYNYVVAARRRGEPVVLKLGVPRDELTCEVEALRLYDGDGVVRLLEADAAGGAMLLERLMPGETLEPLAGEDDEAATAIAGSVLARWRRPPPKDHSFPTVSGWGKAFASIRAQFDGGAGPLPAHLFDRAEQLYGELVASSGPPVVLHGDLHHFNILSATNQPWLAIDPKGVVGEPEYEVGALLRNPSAEIAGDPAVAASRVAQLADLLGFDRLRVRDWGFAQAILSACWSVEEGRSPNPRWLRIAGTLAGLRV